MKILIKVLRGEGCEVEVGEETKVAEIKKQIEGKLKVPVAQQTLLLVGKTMLDEKPLSFYPTVKEGSKLNLVIKKPETLQTVMMRFLQEFYTEAQSKLIHEEFMKDFESRVKNLSLDDLERLATTYMSEECG